MVNQNTLLKKNHRKDAEIKRIKEFTMIRLKYVFQQDRFNLAFRALANKLQLDIDLV